MERWYLARGLRKLKTLEKGLLESAEGLSQIGGLEGRW
jgi:hypothetical protein